MPEGAAGSTPAAPKAKKSTFQKRKGRIGLTFVSPWIVGFLLWSLLPILYSLFLSFQPADLQYFVKDNAQLQKIQEEKEAAAALEEAAEAAAEAEAGTDAEAEEPETEDTDDAGSSGETLNKREFRWYTHWQKLFTDKNVRTGIIVTLRFAALSLPFAILAPLSLAYLVTAKSLKGKTFFRTMFYMPSIIPFVAAVIMFGGIFNSKTGWLNRFLGNIGITGPSWTNDPKWIYPFLVAIGLWGVGNSMIFYIAGMNSVSQDLYDAARVDGATSYRMFRHVTLPIISPVTFYVLVLSVIGLFQYFLVPYVLNGTSGRPANSTLFYNLYFHKVFTLYNSGYEATLAWGLFFAGLLAAILLFGSAKYWVHYEFEEQ